MRGGGSADPKVSVCILNWNGGDMTVDCVRSVLRETRGVDIEVVLVDNGSHDGCAERVQSEHPEVVIIRNDENKGFPVGNNQAIRASRGRYVLLLNNDTVLTEDAVSRMAHFLDEHPDVGMVGCRLRLPDGSIQRSAHRSPEWIDYVVASVFFHRLFPQHKFFGRLNMTHEDYSSTFETDWLAAAAVMVRSDALAQVGLLDERIVAFSEDWEWCMRWKDAGWRVVYFGGTELTHLYGMSTHSSANHEANARRRWSILTAAASADYVYEKRNPREPLRLFLFRLSRRMYFASHGILYCLRVAMGRRGELGRAQGFLGAAVARPKNLRRHYLRGPRRESEDTA